MNHRTVRILCVEDDPLFLKSIKTSLLLHFTVETASSLEAAQNLVTTQKFDCVLLDKHLGEDISFSLISVIKKKNPKTGVILLTSDDSLDSAAEALQLGADDYLVKSMDAFKSLPARITLVIKNTHQNHATHFTPESKLNDLFDSSFVGVSKEMLKLKFEIMKLKGTSSNVLITGESGTGKEVIANAIHAIEANPSRPLNIINCGAIPETLFESEIFGHVKGAFTGAQTDKIGLFELSDGGDLFLDEIGDLSLTNQTKILRALENGEFKPVGSAVTDKASVRIIAATNKNLEKMIEEGLFRGDLYHRLNVVTFETVPLRDRPEDIEVLAIHFLKGFGAGQFSISAPVLKALMKHEYKGNIRELRNTLEKGFINARAAARTSIELTDIAFLKRSVKSTVLKTSDASLSANLSYKEFQLAKEKEYLLHVLKKSGVNAKLAIEKTGISKGYFFILLKKHGIKTKELKENTAQGGPQHDRLN